MARRIRSSVHASRGRQPQQSAETSKTQPPPSGARASVPPRTSIPPSLTARVVENGIVAAAMKVFARRGFAATRVEDVLDEAGVARRTFYRYFTSKEDVLAAVYELATGELLDALDEASESPVDPLAGLRAGVEVYLDFHVENAALLRVLVEQSVRSDSPLAGHRRRFRARVLKVLVRAAETRHVAPLDGFTYVGLLSALEGVALELLEGAASPGDVLRAKKAVHALVESGLLGR
ncbi:MAG: TetR/AcrR family transcriptional regulator [Labilithrix sp.]|nr:TetR/AcrR family transcriptional regulator [Labilithrix sp.]MCW5835280.1 TetR/AcrR family transcriptional regulator [Labilithrix sp.]